MHAEGFLAQAFVYLLAAVVAVPLAKRLGLGSVLGYLIAGVIIGPDVLDLVGEDGQGVLHFAEFGVVMMLFLIGLELEPARLWRLRASILGLGGLQVMATVVVLGGIAMSFGQRWQVALAIGLALSLSSTAIVLQTLREKGLLRTAAGQSSFSVLLFQDIAVIPMLALLPLLATASDALSADGHGGVAWIDGFPGWSRALIVLAAVALIVVGGRFLSRPVLRYVAASRLREVFSAATLLLVVGIALMMDVVGLSPALGTFLAGVVLANSEFRHELESDLEPFKGLLLGLFFLAVGAGIDLDLLVADPGGIALLVLLLFVVKGVVLAVLGKVFGLGLDQNLLFTLALAQGGEFAFVLFSFAVQQHVLSLEVTAPLVVVVALSMAVTPVVLLLHERFLQPRVGTRERPTQEPDVIEEHNPVLLAGYGRYGQIVGRFLHSNGIGATVLDVDSDQVELLRQFGSRVYYGDASRADLLAAAGAEQAKVLILAIDDPATTLEISRTVRKHFPHLRILARAASRTDAYDLIDDGVEHVFRETFDTALRTGVEALRQLGVRAYRAHRAARSFRRVDEQLLVELAGQHHDRKHYVATMRQRRQDAEEVLQTDLDRVGGGSDDAAGWSTRSLRDELDGSDGSDGPDGEAAVTAPPRW